MKKLSTFFYRISTGWVTLAVLIIFLVFCALTLPVESKRMDKYAPGLGDPDTSFLYDSKMMLKWAEAYGESGRAAFLKVRWGFDLAFPVIFTSFFIISISFVYRKGLSDSRSLPIVNLVPLLSFIFDLAENTATSVVMAAYPRHETWGQALAPVFTPLKWIFVSICILLLVIGLSLWLYKGFTKNRPA